MGMLEVIFKSGYTFLGTIILIVIIVEGVEAIIKQIKK
tara:strand:+ start:60 stop:173 length:114 start_codon:yes stop_codon:yes gene_type:complete